MKAIWGLVLGATLAAGCVELPLLHEPPRPPLVPAAPKPAATVSDVTPDEVTAANASQKAEALRKELDSNNADKP
jgi:hypothetical protein